MAEFQFQIGDMVIFKTGEAECSLAAKLGEIRSPLISMVTSRLFDNCPGGTQLFYQVGNGGQTVRVHEEELMPLSEYDAEATATLAFENRARLGMKRHEVREKATYADIRAALATLKEELVALQDFELSAEVRDLSDKVKQKIVPATGPLTPKGQ